MVWLAVQRRAKAYCRSASLEFLGNRRPASGDEGYVIKLDHLVDKARKLWDSSPSQVNFPWNRAFGNFIQLVLHLVLAIVKYLSVPLLAVSSLSKMSYCAHKRKLFMVPVPLIIGLAVAGVLRQTALNVCPILKDTMIWLVIIIVCCCIMVTLMINLSYFL
ncbi:hypothetical protein UlMin_010167 [Ulmus minor]